MNAPELTAELAALTERLSGLRRQVKDMRAAQLRTEAALADVLRENALLRQRLDDHIKRLDTWATRAWGLVPVLVGAVLSLAAGLVVTLARR